MPNKSQKDMILIHLQMHKTITTWEAIDKFHATRLSAIIFNLKQEGHNISSTNMSGGGKKWVEYRLHLEDEKGQFTLIT